MSVTEYLCVGCPLGCRLEVLDDGDRVVEVRGSECKRGKIFAEQEHTRPLRMVTTTVRVRGGIWPKLPVKTVSAVPKPLMRDVCLAVQAMEVEAPVAMGDVVLADVLGTGVDIVATRDMPVA